MLEAAEMIQRLPIVRRVHTFYDGADLSRDAYRRQWASVAHQLQAMSAGQGEREALTLGIWAADAFTALGMFDVALAVLPVLPLGGRASYQTSKRLCLKLELRTEPSADDVLTLFGAKVTRFGRANLAAIGLHIKVALERRLADGASPLLPQWASDAQEVDAGYPLFSGHPSYLVARPPRGLSFDRSATAEAFCVDAIRSAENAWRVEQKIARVGEGWIAETRLFYELTAALQGLEVVHHAALQWLGRQHLDIFIPALATAVEYQGEQHDVPVEFFGGQDAFERTLERDRRKASLCRRNGVRLIYVREGYDLHALVKEIAGPPA